MDEERIRQIVRDENDKMDNQSTYNTLSIPRHIHNGSDSPYVSFTNIINRQQAVWWTLAGTSAATAGNYGVFFTAPYPCTVIGATEVHQTLGTDGSAVTLQIEKLIGAQAPDAGVALLQNAFNLKGTINTVQTGIIVNTIVGNIQYRTLAIGDRLCLKDSGTLTACANVTVVVMLQY